MFFHVVFRNSLSHIPALAPFKAAALGKQAVRAFKAFVMQSFFSAVTWHNSTPLHNTVLSMSCFFPMILLLQQRHSTRLSLSLLPTAHFLLTRRLHLPNHLKRLSQVQCRVHQAHHLHPSPVSPRLWFSLLSLPGPSWRPPPLARSHLELLR